MPPYRKSFSAMKKGKKRRRRGKLPVKVRNPFMQAPVGCWPKHEPERKVIWIPSGPMVVEPMEDNPPSRSLKEPERGFFYSKPCGHWYVWPVEDDEEDEDEPKEDEKSVEESLNDP